MVVNWLTNTHRFVGQMKPWLQAGAHHTPRQKKPNQTKQKPKNCVKNSSDLSGTRTDAKVTMLS